MLLPLTGCVPGWAGKPTHAVLGVGERTRWREQRSHPRREWHALFEQQLLEVEASLYGTLSGALGTQMGTDWDGAPFFSLVREPRTLHVFKGQPQGVLAFL